MRLVVEMRHHYTQRNCKSTVAFRKLLQQRNPWNNTGMAIEAKKRLVLLRCIWYSIEILTVGVNTLL